MKLLRKFALLVASAGAVFFTSQFLAAQTGPTVFTPQLTVSPGFLTVTTGPTTVQDLTILGICSGCGTGTVVANPTGTIGLTPVNGVLTSALRSDGAPALSQAIVPTWTGIHTFNAIPLFNGGTSGVSAPFSVDSNTLITNLNADLLDGFSSGDFCQSDGTNCAGTLDDPSATIGLTPVNGVATTGMRSDGAPALSQAIVPTWTGIHTFNAIPAFNGGTSGISAPFTIDSNTLVTNLNADLLDGLSSAAFALAAVAPANPTASVGLSAVNGSAVTYLRSDGAPALSQSIAPTWTGIHTFNAIPAFNGGASGVSQPFSVDSNTLVTNLNADLLDGLSSGDFAQLAANNVFTGSNTLSSTTVNLLLNETDGALNEKLWNVDFAAGQLRLFTRDDGGTFGAFAAIVDRTGTTVDSIALSATTVTVNGQDVRNTALFNAGILPVARGGTGTTTSTGTGNTVLSASPALTGSPTVAGSLICTADGSNCPGGAVTAASYTGAVSGCTSNPAPTINYAQFGPMVIVTIPNFTCTSNSTSFTVSGAPVAIRPASNCQVQPLARVQDASVVSNAGYACMSAGGLLTFGIGTGAGFSGWTITGTKGTDGTQNIVYSTSN